jgi:hypothetical protein
VLRFLDWYTGELGVWGILPERTVGSAAEKLWRTLDDEPETELTSQRVLSLARQAYHGGRCEAFKVGPIPPCTLYDVRSMYPWAMQAFDYPAPAGTFYHACSCMEERYDNRIYRYAWTPKAGCRHIHPSFLDFDGVADAIVRIPPLYVPPLPVSAGGRVFYPVGRVHGVFTTPELRLALRVGCTVEAIYRLTASKAMVRPFTRFVEVLYQRRQYLRDSGDGRELVVKVLLNALSGRLGLRPELSKESFRPLPSGDTKIDWSGWDIIPMGSRTVLHKEAQHYVPTPTANVLWASLITGHARVRLYELLTQSGSDLLYCDTDSVLASGTAQPAGLGLGSVRVVDQYDGGTILGPKLYWLEGHEGDHLSRVRGVPKAVQEQYLRDGSASFYAPTRIREAMATNAPPGLWTLHVRTQHLGFSARQVVAPYVEAGAPVPSDTIPVVFGPDGAAPMDAKAAPCAEM